MPSDTPSKPASIAVVGAGALGQFYAAQFILAGHELRLLTNRDAGVLAERGLVVYQTASPDIASSGTHPVLRLGPDRFRVSSDPAALALPMPPDWVLVSLKTTALARLGELVQPLAGPRSRVVVLCNGLGVEDRLAAWFDPARIYGLLCYVAINRDADATIHHRGFGQVAAGHFLDDPLCRADLVALCRNAGITCSSPPSLLEARWRKLAWNLPFNGLCVAYDCTADGIVGIPARRGQARALADEVVAIGNAELAATRQTAHIEPEWAELQIQRGEALGPYAPSTLVDARAGHQLEDEVLFLEPLLRAHKLGVPAPQLEWLVSALGVGR
jgi:2-dehydropantoate 2-reductase